MVTKGGVQVEGKWSTRKHRKVRAQATVEESGRLHFISRILRIGRKMFWCDACSTHFPTRDSMYRHRRVAHGAKRAGVQIRQKEANQQRTTIPALMDINCGILICRLSDANVAAPARDGNGTGMEDLSVAPCSAIDVVRDLAAAAGGPQHYGWERAMVVEREKQPSMLLFANENDWLSYIIETAHVWTVIADGYRTEEVLAYVCAGVPTRLQRVVARTMAYACHPRWTPDDLLTSMGVTTDDGLDGRRRRIDKLLASAAPAEQPPARKFRETKV